MSTSLLLGVAGAALAFFTGNPALIGLGFLAGSLIGTLIDPPKSEGPRLGDLKLQVSTYGKMIPYVWGTGRIAGNCIDQTDLEEHKQKSGGKGGPEVTTYTYSASFDLLLCVGPILGIKRIWADARLIWSDTTGDPIPCTVYYGVASQTPDPTFEAIHGVGNVPGYNGYAHVVFADYFLTDFGNRIPQFEFEIYTNVGVFPWRVSSFDPAPTAGYGFNYGVTYVNGEVHVYHYDTTNWIFNERVFDLDGNEDTSQSYSANMDVVPVGLFPVRNMAAASTGAAWIVREHLETVIAVNPIGGASSVAVQGEPFYNNGFIFAIARNQITPLNGVARWPATGGVISAETGTADGAYVFPGALSGSAYDLGSTNKTDVCYVSEDSGPALTLYELSFDLSTVIRQWDLSAADAIDPIINGSGFTVYENARGELILACDRGIVAQKKTAAFYLNSDLSVTTVVTEVDADLATVVGPVVELGTSGYALVQDGIVSLIPPPAPELLSTIVADLSDLTPLNGAYNVSELTDDVRWFAVASQMAVRNAIAILRPLFFFDAVESDDVVVFKKRGGTSVATIPDNDLCARSYGEESDAPLRTIRKKEQGLPRTVTMTYYDVDADYQIGAQSSPRQVTLSQNDVTLDMPVGLTASEALQKCWAIQCAEWIERESFEWSTTRKWAHLEPCDVVIVRGREIRILTRNESPNGVIKWTGVLSAPSIYTQSAQSGVGGFVPQPEGGVNVLTELILLDIPILSQQDSPFGFYAAMGPATDGRWTGAALYKSLDGGVTYNAVATSASPSVIGYTLPSPGSPTVFGILASYGGGDVVDESEICVQLTDDDATLESITATALTNGGNLCAISTGLQGSPATMKWELLQFRDATLIAPKTYILKGFKRGRKGTLTTGHASGDTFVLLPVTNVDAPESELNVSLKYKAVTFGNPLADAAVQDFINTGLSALEYYETEIGHLPGFGGASPGSPSVAGTPGIVPAPAAGDCEQEKYLDACGGWSRPHAMKILTPAYASSLTVDLGNYHGYDIIAVDVGSLTGNIAFDIIRGSNRQIIRVIFEQGGSGGYTFTAGSSLRASVATPFPTLSTTVGMFDRLAFEWHGGDSKADLVAHNIGYA